jgi:hypothetical protein
VNYILHAYTCRVKCSLLVLLVLGGKGVEVSVFSAPTNNRVVKITHSSSEVLL